MSHEAIPTTPESLHLDIGLSAANIKSLCMLRDLLQTTVAEPVRRSLAVHKFFVRCEQQGIRIVSRNSEREQYLPTERGLPDFSQGMGRLQINVGGNAAQFLRRMHSEEGRDAEQVINNAVTQYLGVLEESIQDTQFITIYPDGSTAQLQLLYPL